MNEVSAAAAWLYETLTADADVADLVADRVYEGRAPEGAALPYIVYQYLGGADRRGMGAEKRLFSRPQFIVRAVTQGEGYAAADAIATALDAAIQGTGGPITVDGQDYQVRGCERMQPVRYLEETGDSLRFNHVGGQYRLIVYDV